MILGVKLPKKIVVNFSDHDRHKEIFVALIYETMAKLPDDGGGRSKYRGLLKIYKLLPP